PPAASLLAQRDFDFLGAPGCIGQRLGDIGGLQVWIVAEDLFSAVTRRHKADNGADGDAHAADAWLSTHYAGITSDSCQLRQSDCSSRQRSIVGEPGAAANRAGDVPQEPPKRSET